MSRRNPTVTRTAEVLRLLSKQSHSRMSLSDIARRLEISKSTAHSIVLSLADAGFLLRHSDSSYSLGREVVAIGQAALRRHRALAVARREMELLAEETGLDGAVSVATDTEIVIVGHTDPNAVWVGTRAPLAPPFGGMYIAWSPRPEIERWLGRAGPTHAQTRTRLLRGLAAVRRMGFHIATPIDWLALKAELWKLEGTHDNEQVNRVIREVVGELGSSEDYMVTSLGPRTRIKPYTMSIPVFNASGGIEVAVTLNGFRDLMTSQEIRQLAARLQTAAQHVADAIGGSIPRGRMP